MRANDQDAFMCPYTLPEENACRPHDAQRNALQRCIREQGYTFDGQRQKHHESYLSDPTRTAPARLTTIVRQPIAHR